jgi:hypothetical protein
MFYRPSPAATIPMLMQSMRLAGRYKDNLPLALYATDTIMREIVTGHQMQKELVARVMTKAQPHMPATAIIRGESFHPAKIPKKSVFLAKTRRHQKFLPRISAEDDDGWTLEEFQRPLAMIHTPLPQTTTADAITMDQREFHRLTNPRNGMFKKWANPTDISGIARFMRDGIVPRTKYSKKEITDLWKEYNGDSKIGIACLMNHKMGKGKGYGKIIAKDGKGKYMMYPSLRHAFDRFF